MDTYYPFLGLPMQSVKAICDDLLKFAIDHGDSTPPSVEFATDVIILWDSCAKGEPLPARYEAFQRLLSSRWGVEVSKGTAYFVLEKASALLNDLKKTHLL